MNRILIYMILVLWIIILFVIPEYYTSPYRNLNSLTFQIRNNPTQKTMFKSTTGYLKPSPEGYILVLYSGTENSFSPTEFIMISRIKDRLIINLINGPGENLVITLEGDAAKIYLEKHQILLDEINNILVNN